MKKHDLQNEVYKMVLSYYDSKHPDINDEAISSYMGIIFTADAKTVRKAHKYWVDTIEQEYLA